MRITVSSRLSLLLLTLVAMLLLPSAALAATISPDGTTSTSVPTIHSDKDDYPPGGTVVLSGGNWQPGESVHIYVNDDQTKTWERNVDVVADENGNIRDEFQLPDWFVATYKVTATGAQSGVATTSFTDGNVKLSAAPGTPPGASFTYTAILYNGNACAGDPKSTKANQTATFGGTNTEGVGNNESLKIQVTSVASGWQWDKWTRPGSPAVEFVAGTQDIATTVCIVGFQSGTRDLIGNLKAAPTNSPPVANNDSLTTNEDTAGTVDVLTNDRDPDNDTLSVTSNTAPRNGSVTRNGGTFTYTPADNYNGTDSFTYTVSDGKGGTATGTVSITVKAVNDAPVADDQSVSTNEDIAKDVTLGASDVEGDGLTYTIVQAPAHGQLSGTGANRTYTPDPNYNGPDSFTFKANDGKDDSNVATVTINVTAVNDAPKAMDDAATTNEDTPVVIDVLGNDTDVDDRAADLHVVAASISDAEHGKAELTDSGKIRYTPDANYNNSGGANADTFTYTVSDGSATSENPATVSIAVDPVNDTPEVTAISGAAEANEGDSKNYSVSATDVDGDALRYVWTVKAGAATVTDGAATDTATVKFLDGPDDVNLQVVVDDGNSGGRVTRNLDGTLVSVHNVAPTTSLSADNALSADEGQTKTYAYTITDPGDDTVQSVATSCDAPDGEKVSDAASSLECHFPDGPATATISAQATDSDGDAGNKAEQTVEVANVAPTVTLQGPNQVDESSTEGRLYTFTVSDPGPGDDGAQIDKSCGINGQIKNGSYQYDNETGQGSFRCVFPDGGPASNPTTSSVSVKGTDKDGGSTTDSEKVIIVTVANVAPMIGSVTDDGPVAEGSPATITVAASDAGDPDPLSYEFDCDNDGAYEKGPQAANSTSCTFSDDGTYTVGVKVTDGDGGSATGSTEVRVNNVPPTAVDDDPAAAAEGGQVTLNVLDNDTDPAGANDPLSVTGKTDGAHGKVACQADGSCTYTPNNPDFFGADSFTYTVSDGDGGTDMGTVNVKIYEVNDAPVGNNDAKTTPENQPLTFPASDLVGNDDEGAANEGNQNLTVTQVGAAEHGQVTLNGAQITFTPDADYNGQASFKYTVCDDGTTNGEPDPKCEVLTAIVNVTISPVNSTPEATDGAAQMDEDTAPISIDLGALVFDKETADASLTYNIVQGPTAVQGELTGSGPTFTFDSAKDYFGTFDILYTVTDRGDPDNCSAAPCDTPETSAQKKVTVTVNSINDAPVANNDQVTTDEDTQAIGNVRANDTDVDNAREDLRVTRMSNPDHGTLTLNADGSFTYRPHANYHGADSFTYKVDDGSLDSNVATVDITVSSVNDNPNIDSASGPLNVNEGDTKNYSVTASDVDGDSLAYKWTIVSGPAVISGTDSQNAADVAFRDNGAVALEAKVSDGNGGTDTKTFDIASANVVPTITNVTSLSQNVLAGASNNLLFTGTATDPSRFDTNAGFSWQWSLNGGAYGAFGAPNANTFRTSFTGCGTQTVSAKAQDKDGGISAPFTTNAVNVYSGAYKAPLVDGTVNKVQKGQVVPVKISVGCGTTNLTGLSPHIQLLTGNNSPENESGATAITTSVSSADTGQTMRPVDGGYIYNLRVPSDSSATAGKQYTIRVNPFGADANNAATGMYIVLEIRK